MLILSDVIALLVSAFIYLRYDRVKKRHPPAAALEPTGGTFWKNLDRVWLKGSLGRRKVAVLAGVCVAAAIVAVFSRIFPFVKSESIR